MVNKSTLVVAVLSLTNAIANAKRWNVVHYNYCSSDVTLVFSQRWPSAKGQFNYPPTSANGGTSSAWFESDGVRSYYTTVTAVQGRVNGTGPYPPSGSSVEFNLLGQYDITATRGWNYPVFIQAGMLDQTGNPDVDNNYCTLAQCNSYEKPKCSDYYAQDSGLGVKKRQGNDTQLPNHYCKPDDFDTLRIQTCGQDDGSDQYLFGASCGSGGCDELISRKNNASAVQSQ
jgi:hypothetical protein